MDEAPCDVGGRYQIAGTPRVLTDALGSRKIDITAKYWKHILSGECMLPSDRLFVMVGLAESAIRR